MCVRRLAQAKVGSAVASNMGASLANAEPSPGFSPPSLPAPCSNVIDHPGEERYRRVKLSNPGFQSRLGCRAGGKEQGGVGRRGGAPGPQKVHSYSNNKQEMISHVHVGFV